MAGHRHTFYGRDPMIREHTPKAAAALDPAAFARLYEESLPRVYAFVAARVDDRSAAEEITAATFRRCVEVAAEEALDAQSFRGFLFRVAASAVVDHARRSRGTFPRGVRAGDFDRDTGGRRAAGSRTDELAARAFSTAIDRRALRRAIQRLAEPQRRLVVLRYLDELTVDEQCAALGWTRETLAKRVHAALRALHAALTEEAIDAA